MENFNVRLSKLQEELKAPKNMYNKFGKYSYRNAEGILEAVKPLLVKYGMVLNISDSVEMVGERYYIKATATVHDTESDQIMVSTAYARESLDKKGMDDSQISGTASSYARKYALNGLFLLDDTKDADTDEYHNQTQGNGNKAKNENAAEEQKFNEQAAKEMKEPATEAQKNAILNICNKHKVNLNKLLESNNVTFETMNREQAVWLINAFKKKYGDD